MSVKTPNTPWGIEAVELSKSLDWPFDKCRDSVILRWLEMGDTRALAAWLAAGDVPSQAVLNHVAKMLAPELDPNCDASFSLEAKSRRKGARRRPDKAVRDWLLYQNVARVMDDIGPGGYDSAIQAVATTAGISKETVKKAYDSISKIAKGK